MKKRECPCFYCTKVADTAGCDNKGCKEWKAWFIRRWDNLCSRLSGDLL